MDYTPEQAAAITTHDRNLIVTAGAGSGKTRVLVARFMELLRRNPTWTLPSVVAITFTEKAAREMRDRVRAAIEDEIRAAADDQATLDRWLDHQAALTRARIGTIHALCANLLRANPAEARLDPAFEVLDETESAVLRDDAVDETVARLAAEDRPGTALLTAYNVSDIRRVLFRFAERSKAQTVANAIQPDPLAFWHDQWAEFTAHTLDEVRADAALRGALDAVRPGELPANDKLSDIWRAVHTQIPALLDGSAAEFSAAVDVLASVIKVNVGSAKNWGDKGALEDAKAALKSIRERMQEAQKMLPPLLSARDDDAARWLTCWQDATLLASEVYTARKQDRTALDFDDLETRARDLLTEYDSVVKRYAAEFNHILVDEFQDTNAAQRDIIYRLAGVGKPAADGRLFVVGDPKQSIYAFRGADVSVFGAVRDDLCQRGGLELPLSTSFRTHDNLVSAFNDIFGHILTAQPGPAARFEVDFGVPMTAFRPAEPDHAQPITVFAFRPPDNSLNADDVRRWEAWTLAGHIHAQIAQGARIWDREERIYRPVGYGDVAILFQAMTRVPLYEEIFKAASLPYVTVAGKGYYNRPEVWDLLNLLRALHNPTDDLALAAALRSPLFGLSDDALLSLRLADDHPSLWAALMAGGTPFFPPDDLPARDFARRVLRDLRDMAGRAPIAEVLIQALDLTGFLAMLTGLPDGARRRGNVEKLVRLARASGRVSIGAFNAYARDLTTREIREGEAAVEVEGAVTIMSVHASKGLEFPVVILADAAWSRTYHQGRVFTVDPDVGAACRPPVDDPDEKASDPFAWTMARRLAERRDQAERRRLLYVGATRAQDHLIISGSLKRSGGNTWLRQWLAALGVDGGDLEPQDEPYTLRADWGACALVVPPISTLPETLLSAPRRMDTADVRSAVTWDDPAVIAAEPIDGFAPELPPLLASIPLDPTAPARALTATQLAQLGRAPYYDPALRGWAAVRHSVLHDAPDPLRPLPDRTVDEWALRRLVGEIVHRALQVWSLPDNTPQDALVSRLETYAWTAGLSDDRQIAAAVTLALDLLHRFGSSAVRADLDHAAQVYRELPFTYRAGPRTLHGQIDVLYFDGRDWHVLDYKTSPVSWQGAQDNARRYYLQVGVYARAVEARTGQTPHTDLYYIHPGRRVHVKPEDWNAAFDRLEDDLHFALDVDDQ